MPTANANVLVMMLQCKIKISPAHSASAQSVSQPCVAMYPPSYPVSFAVCVYCLFLRCPNKQDLGARDAAHTAIAEMRNAECIRS